MSALQKNALLKLFRFYEKFTLDEYNTSRQLNINFFDASKCAEKKLMKLHYLAREFLIETVILFIIFYVLMFLRSLSVSKHNLGDTVVSVYFPLFIIALFLSLLVASCRLPMHLREWEISQKPDKAELMRLIDAKALKMQKTMESELNQK